jgi:hypothetical protein
MRETLPVVVRHLPRLTMTRLVLSRPVVDRVQIEHRTEHLARMGHAAVSRVHRKDTRGRDHNVPRKAPSVPHKDIKGRGRGRGRNGPSSVQDRDQVVLVPHAL